MKYYSYINKDYGFGEVTEEEYKKLHGTSEYRQYINKLYKGEITKEEVPVEFLADVENAVEARNTQWGAYESRQVSGDEFMKMVKGIV